jgi:hypothetical protein
MEYQPTENALAARERESKDTSKLIEHISTQRKFQLEHFMGNDPKAFELEKNFGKYLALPIDIPKFDVGDPEKFKDWFFKNSIRPTKQKGDYVADVTGYSPFHSVDLIQEIGEDWNLNLQTENFKKEFPHIWQQFYDELPVSKILTLNLWSSVQSFSEHRDSAEMIDCPSSFRITLYDENPEGTLYVMDNPTKPYSVGETYFLPKLEETNTYMWNNLRCMHGSVKDDNYTQIMDVCVALVDIDRYTEIVSRSVEKYKDHTLVSENKLENYVDV